jgi:peptidoglycan/LPS O-acetylase OafA/YrhL
LRFFAAASIVLFHFRLPAFYAPFGLYLDLPAIGMPLFFTLSGFIIHYIYSDIFAGRWHQAVGAFAVARFSRLYPLYLTMIGYFVAFSPQFAALLADGPLGLSYLSLTQTWWYWHRAGEYIVLQPFGVSWSLSTEWFFYFAYAAGLYRVARIASVRMMIVVLGLACIAAFALNFIFYDNADAIEAAGIRLIPDAIPRSKSFANSLFAWLMLTSPYFRIWEFISGVLTCQLYLLLRNRPSAAAIGGRFFWAGFAWIAAGLIVLGDLEGSHSALLPLAPKTFAFVAFLHSTFLLVPGMILMLLGLACGRCAAARFISLAPLVFGGEISYGIYLGHIPFVASFAALPPDFPSKALGLAIELLAACIIAAGLYTIIEMPAKRFLRRAPAKVRSLIGKFRDDDGAETAVAAGRIARPVEKLEVPV